MLVILVCYRLENPAHNRIVVGSMPAGSTTYCIRQSLNILCLRAPGVGYRSGGMRQEFNGFFLPFGSLPSSAPAGAGLRRRRQRTGGKAGSAHLARVRGGKISAGNGDRREARNQTSCRDGRAGGKSAFARLRSTLPGWTGRAEGDADGPGTFFRSRCENVRVFRRFFQ